MYMKKFKFLQVNEKIKINIKISTKSCIKLIFVLRIENFSISYYQPIQLHCWSCGLHTLVLEILGFIPVPLDQSVQVRSGDMPSYIYIAKDSYFYEIAHKISRSTLYSNTTFSKQDSYLYIFLNKLL